MAAMMPSSAGGGSSAPFRYDNDAIENDLIDPDDGELAFPQCSDAINNALIGGIANLDDLDDPLQSSQAASDRAPLTGNIQSRAGRSNQSTQSYLTSQIPGEDRRAPTNTIDETVWETLHRDLLAVWEKMRQVLWPKYLLGGMLARGDGMGAEERGEAGFGSSGAGGRFGAFGDSLRGLVGRWPDADAVLQGGMSEGLRDWDLWYANPRG